MAEKEITSKDKLVAGAILTTLGIAALGVGLGIRNAYQQTEIRRDNAIKTELGIFEEYKLPGEHLLVPLSEAPVNEIPDSIVNRQGYLAYLTDRKTGEKMVYFAWKLADEAIKVSNVSIDRVKPILSQKDPAAVFDIHPEDYIDKDDRTKATIRDVNGYISGARSVIFSVPEPECKEFRDQSGFKFPWQK